MGVDAAPWPLQRLVHDPPSGEASRLRGSHENVTRIRARTTMMSARFVNKLNRSILIHMQSVACPKRATSTWLPNNAATQNANPSLVYFEEYQGDLEVVLARETVLTHL